MPTDFLAAFGVAIGALVSVVGFLFRLHLADDARRNDENARLQAKADASDARVDRFAGAFERLSKGQVIE